MLTHGGQVFSSILASGLQQRRPACGWARGCSTFIADMPCSCLGTWEDCQMLGRAGWASSPVRSGVSLEMGADLQRVLKQRCFSPLTDNTPDTRRPGFPRGRLSPSTDTHGVLGFSAVLTPELSWTPEGYGLPSDPRLRHKPGPRSSLCFLLTGCKARVPRPPSPPPALVIQRTDPRPQEGLL